MPEITAIHIGLITVMTVVGIVAGWVMRGNRCAEEKEAVNAGWQEQFEAQRTEHGRIVDQNKSLMEQVSQYQASGKDATNRARELSEALKEAFERRDELQREIKEVRSSLQSAVAERNRAQSEAASADILKDKDDKIFNLSRELENWQGRLPPLIEKYRQRNEEAEQLEAELAEAKVRIDSLQQMLGPDQTRVEPVDSESLPEDMVASNDSAELPAVDEADDLVDEAEMLEEDDTGIGIVVDDDDETHIEEHSFASDDGGASPLNDRALDDVSLGENKDDLKQIKGVGPAIEKTLNELGIFRLSQIAAMSEYDIDRVAKRLKGFRSRIYREDWMGQARELQDGDAGKQA